MHFTDRSRGLTDVAPALRAREDDRRNRGLIICINDAASGYGHPHLITASAPSNTMSGTPEKSSSAAPFAPSEPDPARAPLCFVIDGDGSIRHFLSLILHGAGIDTEEFGDGQGLRRALSRRAPDVIFLDIPLEFGGSHRLRRRARQRQLSRPRAAHVESRLGGAGPCQKHRRAARAANAAGVAQAVRHRARSSSCCRTSSSATRRPSPGASILPKPWRMSWIEFWYQPKIDLRRKQLVGAEAFARARHPTHGVLLPSAFMPGAKEAGLIALSELALSKALSAAANFGKLGVNLRMAVNIPVPALVKLDVADIVQTYRPQFEKWPGLIIDVSEEQIVNDLALANDITKRLQHLNVQLAIDDFGRGYSSLVRLEEFAVCRAQTRPRLRGRLRHRQGQCPACARRSSTWRTISAASPSQSASRKPPTPWRWSAWAATTAKASCSANRCGRSASYRCCVSAPDRRPVPARRRRDNEMEKQPA